MTRLSVNINKVATLRNARGENVPDVEKFAADCERFGAEGITVHPRPDERHITRRDVRLLSAIVSTEFNIEGYPSQDFIDLVCEARPAQVTLVPDAAEYGTDRVELYTKPYADMYDEDPARAVAPFVKASEHARAVGLGLNAGHDLNLRNLRYFKNALPLLDEVSIGHAIISDALYLGIENTIARYLLQLK